MAPGAWPSVPAGHRPADRVADGDGVHRVRETAPALRGQGTTGDFGARATQRHLPRPHAQRAARTPLLPRHVCARVTLSS